MAHAFRVTLKGRKQGTLKGDDPEHPDQIVGLNFVNHILSPRDPATGQASGRRVHSPIVFTKEWGAASPQIYQALITNEVLTSVVFAFVSVLPDGTEGTYFLIQLTNAVVVEVRQYIGSAPGEANITRELEDISLVYQTISIEDRIANTSVRDEWGA